MSDHDIEGRPTSARFGISAALGTPFRSDGSVDTAAAIAHASWVLDQGASSITLFGTTGEGASLGTQERFDLLDAILNSGSSAEQIVATICSPSLTDAILQAKSYQSRGVRRMLVTPPFYFKGISNEALFSWYSKFIAATADTSPQYILYHIPQVTGVSVTANLLRNLQEMFGELIYGVKDSSGEWDSTAALLELDDLAVLVGDERQLARGASRGASGAISGMANLFPKRLLGLLETGRSDPQIDALVDELVQSPVTAAVKALIGETHHAPGWHRTRAPLEPTPELVVENLARLLEKFSIQGL